MFWELSQYNAPISAFNAKKIKGKIDPIQCMVAFLFLGRELYLAQEA